MTRKNPDANKRPEPGDGRDALLNAAIAIVARRGLRGLTYRAVAEEAGVTHASVTHHFQSRDRLILEAHAAGVRPLGYISNDSDRLQDLGTDLARIANENEELFAFQYELLLEGRRRPELMEGIERMYDDLRAETAAALELFGCADEDGSLARFVLAAVDG